MEIFKHLADLINSSDSLPLDFDPTLAHLNIKIQQSILFAISCTQNLQYTT